MYGLLAALLLNTANLGAIDSPFLYKALMVRAAPGELLSVIDLYRDRMSVYGAADGEPIILRHRQGDQWDLFLLFPMESFPAYYSPERIEGRERAAAGSGMSDAEFEREIAARVSWREELYVEGPPPDEVRAIADAGTFYHIEMFIALPGKYDALLEQRHMENAYLGALDRPTNMIFTRVAGAAWDLFTLGVYRDLPHYAASAHIPADRADAAAKAAGFEGDDRIGTYMRELILYHRDTLLGRVGN